MPYRPFLFSPGAYYHIYNRGNNKAEIFFERENYLYFLRLLRKYLHEDSVELVAYCLMPNHYHFLVYLITDGFSKRMQPFLLAYTKAVNNRYNRVGALFQGRFKGKLVEKNEYLLHLSRYIHLNPVIAGLVQKAEEWEFSSYRDYLSLRHGTLPKPAVILDQFGFADDYRTFVESGLSEDLTIGIKDYLFE